MDGIWLTLYKLEFSLLTLSTIILYGTYTIILTKWRTDFFNTSNNLENEATAKAVDTLINFETVKYFNNEKHETNLYCNTIKKYQNEYIKLVSSLSLLNLGQNIIFSISLSTAMYLCAVGIVDNNMTIGDLVMINTLLFQLSSPLGFLGSIYRDTKQSLIDTQKIFEILHQDSNITKSFNPLYINNHYIQFSNVSFGYNKNNLVLKNISFNIPDGTSTAIIGPSGCGKSSIIKLLYRLYDVNDGNIYIDNKNIKDLELEHYRKKISFKK